MVGIGGLGICSNGTVASNGTSRNAKGTTTIIQASTHLGDFLVVFEIMLGPTLLDTYPGAFSFEAALLWDLL